ncbi:NifU family protein [Microscilla marina]|uniref:NifU domain protein n=1 Tax=Microscilla marina ATCC 23134 TaxID=313606 RepID=A1ZPB8_MICM2|nr:NifU family protein [Microscilla marina]EAY27657.1 NifU domain protein [Microscilla marina ATCC 23134]
MKQATPKYTTIYTESNPNPNSLKYVINYMLVPDGTTFDFPDAETAQQSPLATELFSKFSYVDRVFMMSNFVTVTKKEEADWHDVAGEVKEFLQGYLEEQKPLLTQDIQDEYDKELNKDEPEIDRKIKGILEEYVRPAVESDGGAINFHSYENGTVKVLLQGSCSGCPSSMVTLKSGIENLLKRMLPEDVKEVVAEGV